MFTFLNISSTYDKTPSALPPLIMGNPPSQLRKAAPRGMHIHERAAGWAHKADVSTSLFMSLLR
ncbi:hypothetical protein cym2001_18390 [Pseudomonas sp. CYM-20-01]|nr:hypothetical protein cym2001_18390 [Pseudomonas sp. CYM-20-01]